MGNINKAFSQLKRETKKLSDIILSPVRLLLLLLIDVYADVYQYEKLICSIQCCLPKGINRQKDMKKILWNLQDTRDPVLWCMKDSCRVTYSVKQYGKHCPLCGDDFTWLVFQINRRKSNDG